MELLGRAMLRDIEEASSAGDLPAYAAELRRSWDRLVSTTRRLAGAMAQDVDLGLANASVYLDAFGHTVVAWMWLRQGLAAARGLARAQGPDVDFYRGKLAACRYFFRWELPRTAPQLALLDALDPTCLEMKPAWF